MFTGYKFTIVVLSFPDYFTKAKAPFTGLLQDILINRVLYQVWIE